MTNPIETIKRVRGALAGFVTESGDIYNGNCYAYWQNSDAYITLDGNFTSDELLALAAHMMGANIIEEQAALIKQQHEALDWHHKLTRCVEYEMSCMSGLKHRTVQALELSAPYAELEDL